MTQKRTVVPKGRELVLVVGKILFNKLNFNCIISDSKIEWVRPYPNDKR